MALEQARKAQAEGWVRHIGFSSHDSVGNIIKLIGTDEFTGMLVQYNALDRHNEPAIVYAAKKHMGVAVMGPIAGGRLVMSQDIVIDQEGPLRVQSPQLALRFVWNNPNVSVALSGMNQMMHIENNAAIADRAGKVSEEENTAIQHLIEENQKLSDLYCTGCGYCMPCPNRVNIPENFRYMNWYRVWGLEGEAKKAYARLGERGAWGPWSGRIEGFRAEMCIQCGECEPKCPQNIPIREQLQEVVKALGL